MGSTWRSILRKASMFSFCLCFIVVDFFCSFLPFFHGVFIWKQQIKAKPKQKQNEYTKRHRHANTHNADHVCYHLKLQRRFPTNQIDDAMAIFVKCTSLYGVFSAESVFSSLRSLDVRIMIACVCVGVLLALAHFSIDYLESYLLQINGRLANAIAQKTKKSIAKTTCWIAFMWSSNFDIRLLHVHCTLHTAFDTDTIQWIMRCKSCCDSELRPPECAHHPVTYKIYCSLLIQK